MRIALALIASRVAEFLKVACSPLWLLFFHFFAFISFDILMFQQVYIGLLQVYRSNTFFLKVYVCTIAFFKCL